METSLHRLINFGRLISSLDAREELSNMGLRPATDAEWQSFVHENPEMDTFNSPTVSVGDGIIQWGVMSNESSQESRSENHEKMWRPRCKFLAFPK